MNRRIILTLWVAACLLWSERLTAQGNAFDQQMSLAKKEKPQPDKATKLEPAPSFTLMDLEGKSVSLKDLKGKVVVLDFWATWCAPCIKSFPAMQMAVEKYKEDPGVEFLFINTWERQENPTEFVRAFMEKRGFDFTVLMDIKDPVSKRNPVVERYGVNGIPVKFIIDADGNIRHTVTGFMGGDNQAQVQELADLIESSRN
jgi:peroxiredoxin